MSKPKKKSKQKAWKVYVSGFLDWPREDNEVAGFDKWKCELNPSGRLLIGAKWPGKTEPDATKGPLAKKLKTIRKTSDGRPIEWTFKALPVVWGIGRQIPARSYDVVINLGLGVYGKGKETTIFLENGARNQRGGGADAVGRTAGRHGGPPTRIEQGAGLTLATSAGSSAKITAAAGELNVSGTRFKFVRKNARSKNHYICNETRYLMLKQVRPNKRLHQTFFIHVPEAKTNREISNLASALKPRIEQLIQP